MTDYLVQGSENLCRFFARKSYNFTSRRNEQLIKCFLSIEAAGMPLDPDISNDSADLQFFKRKKKEFFLRNDFCCQFPSF